MAAYGAQPRTRAQTTRPARPTWSQLFKNVPVQDDSARKALQTFTGGKGDALLDYEDDLIFAQKNGDAGRLHDPARTILIENPIAVTSDSKHPAQAKAFVDFLESQTGQTDLGRQRVPPGGHVRGQRQLPDAGQLFTISDLGGWSSVTTQVLRPGQGAHRRDREVQGRLGQEVGPTPGPVFGPARAPTTEKERSHDNSSHGATLG